MLPSVVFESFVMMSPAPQHRFSTLKNRSTSMRSASFLRSFFSSFRLSFASFSFRPGFRFYISIPRSSQKVLFSFVL